jgi:hypothetical protein
MVDGMYSRSQPHGMRFLPPSALVDVPHVVVDGARSPATLLVLSHWPKSGTPPALAADTSVEIVFRYLAAKEHHVDADFATNDHFDEDGLVGVWILLHPTKALARREMLVDVARAGDFGTPRTRQAARIAFTLSAFADRDTSPLPVATFGGSYPETSAALYEAMLPRLREIVDHPERFEEHWAVEDALLSSSEAALREGRVTIEEVAPLDLAVVTLPDHVARAGVHRFTQKREAVCHPMALHRATDRFVVLLSQGHRHEVQLRYETWVQLASQRPRPRVDLTALAVRLSEEEGSRWIFDGIERITPRLHLESDGESRLAPERFRALLEEALADPAARRWNPY